MARSGDEKIYTPLWGFWPDQIGSLRCEHPHRLAFREKLRNSPSPSISNFLELGPCQGRGKVIGVRIRRSDGEEGCFLWPSSLQELVVLKIIAPGTCSGGIFWSWQSAFQPARGLPAKKKAHWHSSSKLLHLNRIATNRDVQNSKN